MNNVEVDLKAGDRVGLKSGGPAMTVRQMSISGAVLVNWIDDVGHPHQETYWRVQLVPNPVKT